MIKHTARALALLLAAIGLTGLIQAPASAIVDRDCSDFNTQSAAQTFYVNAGPGDPHRLDDDNDGRACETLPAPAASATRTRPAQRR